MTKILIKTLGGRDGSNLAKMIDFVVVIDMNVSNDGNSVDFVDPNSSIMDIETNE